MSKWGVGGPDQHILHKAGFCNPNQTRVHVSQHSYCKASQVNGADISEEEECCIEQGMGGFSPQGIDA